MSAIKFLTANNARDDGEFVQRGRTGGLKVEGANVLPEDMLYRFLDTVGDGSGDTNATGDYSTPEEFLITAPTGYEYVLHRMIVKIQDAATGFVAESYGGLGELTNGMLLRVHDAEDAVVLDLTAGVPVQSNVHWARYCYDATLDGFGSGDDFFLIRWTFANSGNPLVLPPGYSLRLLLRDNLTGLNGHRFHIQGYRRQV